MYVDYSFVINKLLLLIFIRLAFDFDIMRTKIVIDILVLLLVINIHYKKTGLSQRFEKCWDSPKKRWDRVKIPIPAFFFSALQTAAF